eukprot:1315908-Amorphochlora_amoeboformis.AAC.2
MTERSSRELSNIQGSFFGMVCKKCEKKLKAVICPEPWKGDYFKIAWRLYFECFSLVSAGSKNSKAGAVGRKVNQNKLLGMARLKQGSQKAKK